MKKTKYMKNSVLLLISFFVLFTVQIGDMTIAEGIELEECKECHDGIVSIASSDITKDCLTCHDTHGTPKGCCQPVIKSSVEVHDIHADAGQTVPKNSDCAKCHQSPVGCITCHNSHDDIIANGSSDICIDCHGSLPVPRGHANFRKTIAESKHRWTGNNCNTCHGYDYTLNFKNLMTVDIEDSDSLCNICHSYRHGQYVGIVSNASSEYDSECVNCHNPHSTNSTGPGLELAYEESDINISISRTFNSAINMLTEKVPILKNPVLVTMIIIVILASIFEYVLSAHDKDTKVTSSLIRVQYDEALLKTLEIKSTNQKVLNITDLLESHSIYMLGMTIDKISSGDAILYKYVIFIDIGKSDIAKKGLLDMINALEGTVSVDLTNKYEL